ncbi:hypothetical protein BDP27DRAFT_1430805 [Rhodocollybia butyracea]|uniref:Uncharacterized protein n=1 Tax=Rhodocollybia butyracea TaxID=206335 RepID=A0A9P5PCS2_9AGAR|nr:hypothetical protein BDP27DRAFT_1430805 [Rhodocollybia butyracea]
MALASAPFVWNYLTVRDDVSVVRAFPDLAVGSSRFFQVFVHMNDLSVSTVHHRDQILDLATGWF